MAADPRAHSRPDAFLQANRSYPGQWRCHLRDIVAAADRAATEVEITDGETVVHAASFFSLTDRSCGREFFADPGEPPFDRSQWTERY